MRHRAVVSVLMEKEIAAGLYTAPQLFWENSDKCEPGPPYYYSGVQRTSLFLTGISKEILWGFSIPPHNEGHNKHGYIVTTFWFKLNLGGRGEEWGKGKVEGDLHLKIHFHGDRCKRAMLGKVGGFFQRDTEML